MTNNPLLILLLLLFITSNASPLTTTTTNNNKQKQDGQEEYMVGVGMYDTTGPIAGTNMMGYAQPSQISQGLHTRLFARAFIFQSNTNNIKYNFFNSSVSIYSILKIFSDCKDILL